MKPYLFYDREKEQFQKQKIFSLVYQIRSFILSPFIQSSTHNFANVFLRFRVIVYLFNMAERKFRFLNSLSILSGSFLLGEFRPLIRTCCRSVSKNIITSNFNFRLSETKLFTSKRSMVLCTPWEYLLYGVVYFRIKNETFFVGIQKKENGRVIKLVKLKSNTNGTTNLNPD